MDQIGPKMDNQGQKHTQTNIFKKSQYFLLPKTLNILFLLCPHTLAPLCWGSGRSLPATHSLHLKIFPNFSFGSFFIFILYFGFFMFTFCHSLASPQNLSPVFIWSFLMITFTFCHSLAAPQNSPNLLPTKVCLTQIFLGFLILS